MSSQLSERELRLLDDNNLSRVGDKPYEDGYWGTQGDRDFVHLQLFDPDNNLMQFENLPVSQFSINTNNNIEFYPGNHIRNLGFESGTFRLKYNFLRKLAGNESSVLVHTVDKNNTKIGDIYTNTQNIYITETGIIYTGTEDEYKENPTAAEQLAIEDLKYRIDEISPSRTEVRLAAKNINSSYINDFVDIQTIIKLESVENIISFNGNNIYASTNLTMTPDEGGFIFTNKMVNGTLIIPDVYKVNQIVVAAKTGTNVILNPSGEDIINDSLGNILSISDEFEWDATLHDDAISVKNWSDGFLQFDSGDHEGSANLGYHAKWVQREGVAGGTCLKFPDTNGLFVDLEEWPTVEGVKATPNRKLSISQEIQNLQGLGVNHFDIVNIKAEVKSTVAGKGVRFSLRYASELATEVKPTVAPIGYFDPSSDGPTEPQPEDAPIGYTTPMDQALGIEPAPPSTETEMLALYQSMTSTGFRYQTEGRSREANLGDSNIADAAGEGTCTIPNQIGAWKIIGINTDGETSYSWGPSDLANTPVNDMAGELSPLEQWEWDGSEWVVGPLYANSPTPPFGVTSNQNENVVNYHPYANRDNDYDGKTLYKRTRSRGQNSGWQTGTITGKANEAATKAFLFKDDLVWESRLDDDYTDNNTAFHLYTIEEWVGNNLLRTTNVMGADGISRPLYDDIFENGFIQSITRARDTGNDNPCLSNFGFLIFYNDGRTQEGAGSNTTSNKWFHLNRQPSESPHALMRGEEVVDTVNTLHSLSELLNSEVVLEQNNFEVSFERNGNKFNYFFLIGTSVHHIQDGTGNIYDGGGVNTQNDSFPKDITDQMGHFEGGGFGNQVPDVLLPKDPTTLSDPISRHMAIFGDQLILQNGDGDILGSPINVNTKFFNAGKVGTLGKALTYGVRNPGANNKGPFDGDQGNGERLGIGFDSPFDGFLTSGQSTIGVVYDNGLADFDYDTNPDMAGTVSLDGEGLYTWNGSEWVESGFMPPRYIYKELYNEEGSYMFPNSVGVWETKNIEVIIPDDWLLGTKWQLYVYGQNAGQEDARSQQGVVWVDNLYMDFTLVGQSVTQEVFKNFSAKILSVDGTTINVNRSIEEYAGKIGAIDADEDSNPDIYNLTDNLSAFTNFKVAYTNFNRKDLRTYLKFGNDLFLTTNFKQDKINVSNYPHGIVYKLYQPLPDSYQTFDECIVVKEMANPLLETIKIVDFVPEEEGKFVLKSPDLSNVESPIQVRETLYKTESEILTTDDAISAALRNEFLSQSLDSVKINTDYSQYANFVNFSSIEKRIRNFKTKLQNIEEFSLLSGSFQGISGSKGDSDLYKNNIIEAKNNFDSFENYMYFQSSSYVSSSLGVFHDNTWPKLSGGGTFNSPYVLAHTTSSVANTWFINAMTSASAYDLENSSKLSNIIPEHIKIDTANDTYLHFTDMIAQHFDHIWEYINSLSDTFDRRDSLSEGVSKDLLYSVAKSLGWSLNDGKDLISLSKYALGKEVTGSAYSDYSTTSERDVSREIWSRIINNMPFFLKNKGTVRALKGLINIYGIPSTILRVKEYGGPDLADDASPQFEITRKFTKALDFRGGQSVKVAWADDTTSGRKPDSVEFRFRAASGSNQILVEKKDGNNQNWFIRLKDNGSTDNYGHVSFMLSGSAVGVDVGQYKEITSSALPIYDGDFYSVMVNRTSGSSNINVSQSYELSVGKYDSGRSKIHLYTTVKMDVTQSPSASFSNAWTGSGDIHIGGSGDINGVGVQFTGSIMEYRHWTEVLNTGSFKNHIANPKAYDGNTISSSYENLVLRYSFDDNKNLNADVEGIRDVSANQTATLSGSHAGFTGNFFRSVVDELKTHIPSIGALRRTTDKIRIEENKIKKGFTLSSEHRATNSAYDSAPNDSNRVGIWFAPTDVINNDIINSVGNLNFEDYLGDPRDKKEMSYRGLNYVADNYWKKYTAPNNFWDYMRMIKYYDQSLYPQLRKLIPARAKPDLGLLIEPNIFERPKIIIGKKPTADNIYYSSSIDIGSEVDGTIVITGSYNEGHVVTNYDAYTGRIGIFSYETGSSVVSASGENITFEASGSEIYKRAFELSVFQKLRGNYEFYGNATMSLGSFDIAREVLQPVISGSRIYNRNQKTMNFYTSSADELNINPNSSSFYPVDIDNLSEESTARFNSYYGGVKNTARTTSDGGTPVEVIISAPTKLVTTKDGDSTLKTGDGITSDFKEKQSKEEKKLLTKNRRTKTIKGKSKRGLKGIFKRPETDGDRKKEIKDKTFQKDKKSGKIDEKFTNKKSEK